MAELEEIVPATTKSAAILTPSPSKPVLTWTPGGVKNLDEELDDLIESVLKQIPPPPPWQKHNIEQAAEGVKRVIYEQVRLVWFAHAPPVSAVMSGRLRPECACNGWIIVNPLSGLGSERCDEADASVFHQRSAYPT